jgi:hypothetical protein
MRLPSATASSLTRSAGSALLRGAGILDSVFRSKDSLFARNDSLLLPIGNSFPTAWVDSEFPRATASAMPESGDIPSIFPVHQGMHRRDEFALDSPHLLGVRLGLRRPSRFLTDSFSDRSGVALEAGCPTTRSTASESCDTETYRSDPSMRPEIPAIPQGFGD